ncbi:HAMP domain-containing protein [Sphingomonas sp. CGMCC 1.13654]|uniref:histidine kinase n=1 Tax=Sphingomonas chungangi TaxID=2683589 RepID=A0A838L9B7_9SPHN|nr:ATP-binding protein [Sphingomonas chungangi]MBA2935617.1 HAMP domain-containing protein [Sphingomonas chungangi]MVW54308.1 HAMP domain-containing protein [Sphingomonas chungangi]
MDAAQATTPQTATDRQPRWRRRLTVLRRRGVLIGAVEILTVIAALAISLGSWAYISRSGSPETLLTPPLVALLLVANLVPWMGILVLIARRIALQRVAGSSGGRMHVRLVATFSAVAAVPTLLVVIFASLLFQYNAAFWFSDSARAVLVSSDRVAQSYVRENGDALRGEMIAMTGNFREALSQVSTLDDPRMPAFLVEQYTYRHLYELALVGVGQDGAPHILLFTNLASNRTAAELLPKAMIATLDKGATLSEVAGNRIEGRIAVDPKARLYLYASRRLDPLVVAQATRARSALGDYTSLLNRSRSLQLRFNALLLGSALLIVAASIWIAFTVANRLTRPITDLVGAARRITLGDLTVRVPPAVRRDEVGALATAFNRMTRRLEEQTGALVTANAQLDQRRALTEAVLSGVSAGVISVDGERRIRLSNESADRMLRAGDESAIGRPLAEVSPELDRLIGEGQRESIVQIVSGGEMRTLAVTLVPSDGGHVLTFDDITQQLLDQRRAAWSDVARRIAHEIKNPLTPIQLAAERLQRRYGKDIPADDTTFERLTQTIVRQVGDMRRMVDEFSSFARVPKPVFRSEPIVEVARQALFLHEVAHPSIRFSLDAPDPSPVVVCDRRLLGQALTNIVKNAAEAIVEKHEEGQPIGGAIEMVIRAGENRLGIQVSDTGIGLPAERERLTEPYMTTRAKGTGLGLAIVKKIVEEHFGTIGFTDRPGGGTVVSILLDTDTLSSLGGEAMPLEDTGMGTETRPELTRMKAG